MPQSRPLIISPRRNLAIGRGLVSVILADGRIADPISGAVLAAGSAGGLATSRYGAAIKGTAVNQGNSCLAPDSLKFTGPISLFWFGDIFGDPTGGEAVYLGVSYTNTDSSPYLGYSLSRSIGPDLDFLYNTSGTFGLWRWPAILPATGTHGILITA